MNHTNQYLGIVHDGKFQQLVPNPESGATARFTNIQPQESVPPESEELDLTQYEGKAIMICGHDQGGWVYSAEVIDQAGPILTTVVQEVFRRMKWATEL